MCASIATILRYHLVQQGPSFPDQVDVSIDRGKAEYNADFPYDCWILTDEMPSFVQFLGPLQIMGPIVRIELISPRLSAKPGDKRSSGN
jgi:hypothetical protein